MGGNVILAISNTLRLFIEENQKEANGFKKEEENSVEENGRKDLHICDLWDMLDSIKQSSTSKLRERNVKEPFNLLKMN